MRLSARSAAAARLLGNNYSYADGEEPLRCGGCAKDENGKKTPPIPLRSLEETAVSYCTRYSGLVETTGIEPVTPCMSSKYSNQLSYASVWNGTIITRSAQFVNSLVKICNQNVIFSCDGADFAEHTIDIVQKLRRFRPLLPKFCKIYGSQSGTSSVKREERSAAERWDR